MYLPILINWTSPFPFLGLFGGIFIQILKRNFCKQTYENPDQTLPFALSDLVLHCLPISHKKDARLIKKLMVNKFLPTFFKIQTAKIPT